MRLSLFFFSPSPQGTPSYPPPVYCTHRTAVLSPPQDHLHARFPSLSLVHFINPSSAPFISARPSAHHLPPPSTITDPLPHRRLRAPPPADIGRTARQLAQAAISSPRPYRPTLPPLPSLRPLAPSLFHSLDRRPSSVAVPNLPPSAPNPLRSSETRPPNPCNPSDAVAFATSPRVCPGAPTFAFFVCPFLGERMGSRS